MVAETEEIPQPGNTLIAYFEEHANELPPNYIDELLHPLYHMANRLIYGSPHPDHVRAREVYDAIMSSMYDMQSETGKFYTLMHEALWGNDPCIPMQASVGGYEQLLLREHLIT